MPDLVESRSETLLVVIQDEEDEHRERLATGLPAERYREIVGFWNQLEATTGRRCMACISPFSPDRPEGARCLYCESHSSEPSFTTQAREFRQDTGQTPTARWYQERCEERALPHYRAPPYRPAPRSPTPGTDPEIRPLPVPRTHSFLPSCLHCGRQPPFPAGTCPRCLPYIKLDSVPVLYGITLARDDANDLGLCLSSYSYERQILNWVSLQSVRGERC